MAYGRVYIENLSKKVTALFDELKAENKLSQKEFIEAFKVKYPKDYSLLVYEWEFKVHEFKKNRKGTPKPKPIRPEKILSNMYQNYYYKLVMKPRDEKLKEKVVNSIRVFAGKIGYKIRKTENNRFDLLSKENQEMVAANLTYGELRILFAVKKKEAVEQRIKERKE